MNFDHPTHHLCETKSLLELEAIKNEAYSRPEKFPFERLMATTAWAMKALEESLKNLEMPAK
jgi:hypothetical protein